LSKILSSPIEYLKGVGPSKAELIKKELGVFTFGDLLELFPYRHIDRTQITKIKDINYATDFVQVAGKITQLEQLGDKRSRRLVAYLHDGTGEIELIWFQGITWIEKSLSIGVSYLVYGKAGFFNNQPQIAHPETELITSEKTSSKNVLEPIYPSTEKLRLRGLGGKQLALLTNHLFTLLSPKDLQENLPDEIINKYVLMPRYRAFQAIHFPTSVEEYQAAIRRLKFEELFIAQLRLGLMRFGRHSFSKGSVFDKVGELFTDFYQNHMPYELTGAQKKVLKEIRKDTGSGKQMNRLLQGDVGSGKTMVALLCMLIAAGNGYQSCLMAPTEILARQHLASISTLVKPIKISIKLLTGSTPNKIKKEILEACLKGDVDILIGTHAIIEETVQFKNLGLAIADEQHRFGVAQRAKLWKKNTVPPHILVMTATPIPRTLALTAYGDLDYSVMNELPPGRHPVKTVHRFENARLQVMDFIREEIVKGRQAYIIYPLIEESEKLDYENLTKGYEEVKAFFPEPKYWISMVHGRQKSGIKDSNMQKFVTGDTNIMVSTTVIEVGVDVPNATVMVIESAEKFGLPQLHQLRGRVGRGAEKSYCVLLTGRKLSADARQRIKIMCETNDGFKIAEKDLEIRGPGEIEGTKQSGILGFKLANIVEDRAMLEVARTIAEEIIESDAGLALPKHTMIKEFLQSKKGDTAWSKIS
jgi:ATP-dependent DNA helicase RecG